MTNLIGQSIGRYHILEQIGEGGMAIVYKAYDTRLERDVAVKIIRVDQFGKAAIEIILKRFEREAKSLARLTHPNIIRINDYGEHEGVPYLVMDYLPGGTIKERMHLPMSWEAATRLLLPVSNALEYAHAHKIIHRDIKPANILLTENGHPMLTDFGIAKILETESGQTLTGTGVGIGTPEYMAPEQAMGNEVDARVDIYSLGIVFYELVTGRKPYTADTPMAVIFKHLSDPLPRPQHYVPDLPEAVEKVLIKALAKKPEDRYESMSAFCKVLEALLTSNAMSDKASQEENLTKDATISIPREKAAINSGAKKVKFKIDNPLTKLKNSETKTVSTMEMVQPAQKTRSFVAWIVLGATGLILVSMLTVLVFLSGRLGRSRTAQVLLTGTPSLTVTPPLVRTIGITPTQLEVSPLPLPTATPNSRILVPLDYGKLIYEDNFEIDNETWSLQAGSSIKDGMLILEPNTSASPYSDNQYSDFIFETAFRHINPAGDSETDFYLRQQVPPCPGWVCSIQIWISGDWKSLGSRRIMANAKSLRILNSSAASQLSSTDWNKLTIIVKDNLYEIFVNDVFVNSFTDSEYKMGKFTIASNPGATAFDFVRIYALP